MVDADPHAHEKQLPYFASQRRGGPSHHARGEGTDRLVVINGVNAIDHVLTVAQTYIAIEFYGPNI